MDKVSQVKQEIINRFFNDLDPYEHLSDSELVQYFEEEFDAGLTIEEINQLRYGT